MNEPEVCPRCKRPVGHESRTYGTPEDVAKGVRPRPRVVYHLGCWLADYQELMDRGEDVDLS